MVNCDSVGGIDMDINGMIVGKPSASSVVTAGTSIYRQDRSSHTVSD